MAEEMTIREIDAEITRLRNLRYEKEKQEIADFKIAAQQHVGRCFKTDGCYVMVLGVPMERLTKTGIDYNRYQFPALFIRHTKGFKRHKISHEYLEPMDVENLFSGAWGDGHNILEKKYEEITPDEFYSYFCEALHGIRLSVKDIIDARKERLQNELHGSGGGTSRSE